MFWVGLAACRLLASQSHADRVAYARSVSEREQPVVKVTVTVNVPGTAGAENATSPRHVARVIVARPDCSVLLAQTAGDMPLPGRWALPGGGKEPSDASAVDTGIRELFEETGIRATADEVTELTHGNARWQ